MIIGYARVSTHEQNLDLQKDALLKEGCEQIFEDKTNGVIKERTGLNKLKEIIRKDDSVVVWRLDRLSRSLSDLIEWMNFFEKKDVNFISLHENIDTRSITGKLIFHVFGALAEFEHNLIRERSKAGMEAARARGRFGGRPKKLDENKRKACVELYKAKRHTLKEICEMMEISRPTLYHYLKSN